MTTSMRPNRRTAFAYGGGSRRIGGRRWGAFGSSSSNSQPLIPLTSIVESPLNHFPLQQRTNKIDAFFRKLSVMCFVLFVTFLSVTKVSMRQEKVQQQRKAAAEVLAASDAAATSTTIASDGDGTGTVIAAEEEDVVVTAAELSDLKYELASSEKSETSASPLRESSGLIDEDGAAVATSTTATSGLSPPNVHLHSQKPQVCSHQLLNPPPGTTVQGGKSDSDDGSLHAMTSLWQVGGITCFDIDVVTLQDGTLVATHPRRLATALSKQLGILVEESQVQERNLSSLQSALGEHMASFPLLDTQLLPHYTALVQGFHPFFDNASTQQQQQENNVLVTTESPPPKLDGPLLNLDLKQGPYLTTERLMYIVDTIQKLQLESHVAICVTPMSTTEQNNGTGTLDILTILHMYNENLLQLAAATAAVASDANAEGVAPLPALPPPPLKRPIPLGLVLRDHEVDDRRVDRIRQLVQDHASSIRLLVPSFKFPSTWYLEVASTPALSQLPMTVWTVDSPEDYDHATSMNVTAVVANEPMDYCCGDDTMVEQISR